MPSYIWQYCWGDSSSLIWLNESLPSLMYAAAAKWPSIVIICHIWRRPGGIPTWGEGCVDILVHGFRCHQIVFPIRDKEGFYLFTKHDTLLISPPSTALSSYRVSCWWLGRTPMLWLLTSLQMLSQGLSSCLLGPSSLVKSQLSPSLIGSSWGWQHCKCCPCKLGLHCWEFWVNTDWFALWGCGPKILVRCPEQ